MTNLTETFAVLAANLTANAKNTMEQNNQVAIQTQKAITSAFKQITTAQQVTAVPEPVAQGSVNTNEMINQLMEQNRLLQEQMAMLAAAQQVEKTNVVVPTPSPVVKQPVKEVTPFIDIAADTAISDKESFELHISIQKPCDTCPFQSVCELQNSRFSDDCGVSEMKQAALLAGDMEIHVKDSTYKVYKNGLYIGNVALVRENRPLLASLDFYNNKVVHISTMLKPVSKTVMKDEYSVFTKLSIVINGAKDIKSEPVDYPTESDSLVDDYSSEEFYASLETTLEEEVTHDANDSEPIVEQPAKSNRLVGKIVLPI